MQVRVFSIFIGCKYLAVIKHALEFITTTSAKELERDEDANRETDVRVY